MPKMNVYLNFNGAAEAAFKFYQSVFGGEFTSLVRYQDMPMEGVHIPPAEARKIMHISLPIGKDETLMASDSLESLGQTLVQGNNVYIFIAPASQAEADRLFNALAAGGDVEMPMAKQIWGDYYGSLKDQFGVCWMINYAYPRTT
jgi:PhnB protein